MQPPTDIDFDTLISWIQFLRTNPERMGRLFKPARFDQLESACLEVEEHGYGKVEIVYRDGKVVGINIVKQGN